VHRWPGRSSKSLYHSAVEIDGCDVALNRHEIARRLPELEAAGRVHRRKRGESYIRDEYGVCWCRGRRRWRRGRGGCSDDHRPPTIWLVETIAR